MRRIAIGLAIGLMGCTEPPADSLWPDPEETAAQQSDAVVYGGSGHLDASQEATLKGLAWPQTYGDMKGTFGLPNQRTEEADIYKLESGAEIRGIYEGTEATGFEVP
ncbi:MAG: hypothetical protein ACFB0C_24305 [Leptolyngbyaceae cyanobacterium]